MSLISILAGVMMASISYAVRIKYGLFYPFRSLLNRITIVAAVTGIALIIYGVQGEIL